MIAGWCERWTAVGARVSNRGHGGYETALAFVNRAKALRETGFDVTVLVAGDYSHAVLMACDVDALTATSPQVVWVELGGQLPIEAA